MDLKRLGVSIDPTEAQKGAKQVERSLDGIGQSAERNLGRADNEVKKFGRSTQVTANRSRGAFDRMRATITGLVGGVNRLGGSFLRLTRNILQSGRAAQGTKGKLSEITGESASLQAQSALAAAGMGRLAGAMGFVAGAAGAALPVLGALLAILLPLIVAVKTLTTLFGLMKRAVGVAGEIQRLEISFTALTGSAQEANEVLVELRRNAKETGVAVADQARTVQKFIALGFETDDALELQRSILDIAGAVGLTAAEANLLGTALAQVQAKGVASMEELRQQIAEKGVPIFEELSRKTGLFGSDLFDAIAKGEIAASSVIEIFQNLEGSFARFRGGAQRLAQTVPGQIAIIRESFNDLLLAFGQPIADAIGPILNDLIAILQTGEPFARRFGEAIGNAIRILYQAISDGTLEKLLGLTFLAGVEIFVEGLFGGFKKAVNFFGTLWKSTVEFAGTALGNVLGNTFESVVNFFRRLLVTVIQFFADKVAEIILNVNAATNQEFAVPAPVPLPADSNLFEPDRRSFADFFKANSGQDFVGDVLGQNPVGTTFRDAAGQEAGNLLQKSLEANPAGSFTFAGGDDQSGGGLGGGTGSGGASSEAAKSAKETNKEIEKQLTLIEQLKKDLGEMVTEWGNVNQIVSDIATGSITAFAENLSSALVNIATGAQSAGDAFRDMANSIVQSIIQMVIQMTIQLAVAQALAALGIPPAATGAVIGGIGSATSSHAGTGNGGPVTTNRGFSKFHNGGVLSSENLALTDNNETVLTRRRAEDLERELSQAREGGEPSGDRGGQPLQIINVLDEKEVLRMVAANPDVTVNAISQRRMQVDGVLKRQG